ncbi:hypothetical protein GCAAIG_00255 [Candidatus Electronema halotolerans]
MTKLPAVAVFFAAAAVLSGCQPQNYYTNCPVEPSWTRGDYYSTSSGWAETYPDDVYVDDSVYVDSSADDVYVDDNTYVDNGHYVDDSSVIVDDGYVDDGYSYQDSTYYDDPGVEEYYPSSSSYYPSSSSSYYFPSSSYNDPGVEEYYPSDSSYYAPSSSYVPSSNSSMYYSPWSRPSVSYPSPTWKNRFIGQQPSMYFYPSGNSNSMPNWQQAYPYYY